MGGAAWSQSALNGSYLDRIIAGPDGSLIATGDAMYTSRGWRGLDQVDIQVFDCRRPRLPLDRSTKHGAPTGKNLGLASCSDRKLDLRRNQQRPVSYRHAYRSPNRDWSSRARPSARSRSTRRPGSIWAGSSGGLMRSVHRVPPWTDGGDWACRSRMLYQPSPLTYCVALRGRFHRRVFQLERCSGKSAACIDSLGWWT